VDKLKKLFTGIWEFFCKLFEADEETLEDMRPICSKCKQLKEQLPTMLAIEDPDIGGFNTVIKYYPCKHCEQQTQKE
jgi:hypothetical protein